MTRAFWPQEMIDDIEATYVLAGADGVVDLDGLSVRWGKPKSNIARKARALGLTSQSRRKVTDRKVRVPLYATQAERNAAVGRATKERLARDGHPRGMLGKKHTAEVRRQISEKSKQFWEGLTEQQRADLNLKMLKAKVAKDIPIANHTKRGSWKAGWREIGGKRNYYRSRWEANYARFLECLKVSGEIVDWQHEPETFWFDGILRGVRSYKPDFRVIGGTSPDASTLHEVKGWMDARSHTTLKRMAKYHPDETIILIRERQYNAIARNYAAFIEGWEA